MTLFVSKLPNSMSFLYPLLVKKPTFDFKKCPRNNRVFSKMAISAHFSGHTPTFEIVFGQRFWAQKPRNYAEFHDTFSVNGQKPTFLPINPSKIFYFTLSIDSRKTPAKVGFWPELENDTFSVSNKNVACSERDRVCFLGMSYICG